MSSSEAERQAANVLPPRLSATKGVGVTVIATTTASAATDLFTNGLPGDAFSRYWTIMAVGADTYFGFSMSGAATVAGGATGTGATTCGLLKDGVATSVRLDENFDRYIVLAAATGTGVVRMYPSSQPHIYTDR